MSPSPLNEDPSKRASSEFTAPSSSGVLHLIGLGLGDERDVTLRGMDLIRSAGVVYLEAYTSILGVSAPALEKAYGRSVCIADREFVEERAQEILTNAQSQPGGAAFLVIGDPFGATTHTDLWLRARERGLKVNVVHNASIINAIAVTGLQLYLFGQAISLCFWTDTDRPTSYYPKLLQNRRNGLHTLCLLDIKVKEPSLESLARGKKLYEPPRYMTVNQAIDQLLEIDSILEADELVEDTMAVGVARIGQPNQLIVYASLGTLRQTDFGPPLHSLVIPARELHFHEEEVLSWFKPKSHDTTKPQIS
ncbi:Diphthine synthase [Chondrus crispus]|uniref:diphthine methyl ester synthase n=1 Tax=Chondrus crispus TaxID=2769 RepID=R7QRF0_CHOCR|nr:Diphthine synthase [Chondrus crispus]CDF40724.1 Diphthine synthase [Chondrus crispus]|eukprot:XP_005711018.1 Diphthine synthase [Chondrus crispus]